MKAPHQTPHSTAKHCKATKSRVVAPPRTLIAKPLHMVVGVLQRMGGAYLPALRAPKCASDRTKFALAGVFVCITTLLAFAGGFFTMMSVFHNKSSAIIAGAVWCSFVATLDISILNSIRRRSTASFGKTLTLVITRIILIAALGVGVGHSVIDRVLDDEISVQVLVDQREKSANYEKEIASRYPDVAALKAERMRVTAELAPYETDWRKAERDVQDEVRGEAVSGKDGCGPICLDKKAVAATMKGSFEKAKFDAAPRLARIDSMLNARDIAISTERRDFESKIHDANGFKARYDALQHLEASPVDGESTRKLHYFLIAMAIAIELAPLGTKFASSRGPYDAELERLETLSTSRSDIRRVEKEEAMKLASNSRRARRMVFRQFMLKQYDSLLNALGKQVDAMESKKGATTPKAARDVRDKVREDVEKSLSMDAYRRRRSYGA